MGRTLEVLKRLDGNRSRLSEETSVTASPPVQPAHDARETDEIPFIEVGGPHKVIEGSKEVLASPIKVLSLARPSQPAPRAEPSLAAPGLEAWTVQFRPLSLPAPSPSTGRQWFSPELIAFHHPEHAASEQYRNLLAGIIAQLTPGWGQVLLFTAPAPWAGTTTVLLNLAITAAKQEGRRVAVVDANLRRPALAERLGLAAGPGLREVLAGGASLPQGLQETRQLNLQALPAGRADGDNVRLPFDFLLPTLRQLRNLFDLVFVDAPSWNEGSEVAALAATCDVVYIVMRQRDGEPAETANPLPLLRQPPSNLQGCILTMR